MFEAYKVGVTLALQNNLSAGLKSIARDLATAQTHLDAFKRHIAETNKGTDQLAARVNKAERAVRKLNQTLGQMPQGGAAMPGGPMPIPPVGGGKGGGRSPIDWYYSGYMLHRAGGMGIDAIRDVVKPASEYAHQLNIMNMAGMKQQEIAEAVRDAWKNTRDVITTTPTGNLRAILDLRNVTGSLEEAKQLLPIVTKIGGVMAASSEGRISGHADDIAFSMAKALDIVGAVQNPAELSKQAEMMAKVVTATQNRVNPAMFQSVFQYARQGKFDLSDEFKYEILPTLMLESAGKGSGGGSRGVGPMIAAMYRVTNQGYINKKSLSEWQKLGYVDGSTALKTTTSGTTVGAMRDAAGAASNPFDWVQGLVAKIRSVYGANVSDEFIRQELNGLFRGNQLAASGAVEFFAKEKNYRRDQQIMRNAQGYQTAFGEAMKNDPETNYRALGAQWETFKTAFGKNVVPYLIPVLQKMTSALNTLGNAFERHPTLATTLLGVAGGLSALAFIGGGLVIASSALKLIVAPFESLAGLELGTVATGLSGVAIALARIAGPAAAFAAGGWYGSGYAFEKGQDIGHWINRQLGRESAGGSSDSWAPPPSNDNKKGGQGDVYLDGNKVGVILDNRQAKLGSRPPTGPSGFDGRSMPDWHGVSGAY